MNEARYLRENGSRTAVDESYVTALRAKWAPMLVGIKDSYRSGVTAMLLENEMQHLQSLNEETLSTGVGSFTKYIFPILRRVFPNLIANEIMSVQPMSAPIGAVFTYEYKYTNSKGGIVADQNLIETFNAYYSAEYVDTEAYGTGDGKTVAFSHTMAWTPVRALDTDYGFVVTITDGVETFTDNGSGVLAGDAGGTGTVNYTTGAASVTFAVAPLLAAAITATYYYNSESNSEIPEVDIEISMSEVRAQTRKLKARWSAEAADDLKAFHGIDAETEMVAGIANQIALEIDREMIDLQVSNSATNMAFTYNPSANFIGEMDSIRAVITKLSAISSKIHKLSKRAPANYIVAPPEIVALLEQLTTHGDYRPAFQTDPSVAGGPMGGVQGQGYGPLTSNFGVMRVGTLLNKWAVYQDPFLDATATNKRLLIGLKGSSFMDAGSVYAPYIPLQVTPTFLDPNDFSFRKGMRTRYSKKMLRPEFYGTLTVSGLPT